MGGQSTEKRGEIPNITFMYMLHMFASLGDKVSIGVAVAESIHVAKQKSAAICHTELVTKIKVLQHPFHIKDAFLHLIWGS